jgi:hypothetical protein
LGPPWLSASASPAVGPCGIPLLLDPDEAGVELELELDEAGVELAELLDELEEPPPPQPASASAISTKRSPA